MPPAVVAAGAVSLIVVPHVAALFVKVDVGATTPLTASGAMPAVAVTRVLSRLHEDVGRHT